MSYDDWKTESREDEQERFDRSARRRIEKAMWQEEHEDMLREDREERRHDSYDGPMGIFTDFEGCDSI